MGLDLTPRDYLEMLTDEYREYRDNRLSMRKAINCCGLSNALPEVITAHHNPTDSPKDLIAALGLLELDHVGTEEAENLRAGGPSLVVRHVDDADA